MTSSSPQAKAANPKLKLVLGEPFVKPTGKIDEGIRKRQEIVARLAQKHGAALVHFQRVFDEAAQAGAGRLLDLGQRASDLSRPPTHGRRMGARRPRILEIDRLPFRARLKAR